MNDDGVLQGIIIGVISALITAVIVKNREILFSVSIILGFLLLFGISLVFIWITLLEMGWWVAALLVFVSIGIAFISTDPYDLWIVLFEPIAFVSSFSFSTIALFLGYLAWNHFAS